MSGGEPSLRFTAALIYGSTTQGMMDIETPECDAVAESMKQSVLRHFEPSFFVDVGGSEAWTTLENALDTKLAKLIRRGDHFDEGDIMFGMMKGRCAI
eukprot:gene24696-10329_t